MNQKYFKKKFLRHCYLYNHASTHTNNIWKTMKPELTNNIYKQKIKPEFKKKRELDNFKTSCIFQWMHCMFILYRIFQIVQLKFICNVRIACHVWFGVFLTCEKKTRIYSMHLKKKHFLILCFSIADFTSISTT